MLLHLDVGPGDGEDGSRAVRCSRHHSKAACPLLHEGHGVNDGVAGEVGLQVTLPVGVRRQVTEGGSEVSRFFILSCLNNCP